ncbi:phage tail protein [Nitriliruptor alkaliphilus]|uniref:phage tail protein n=1 Tax=Nitriliruptor alkaliphilus TaxID=427918 RepID=UPI0009F8E89A|nr:phage tail protein [Nitriliruptor alkaliphilus]
MALDFMSGDAATSHIYQVECDGITLAQFQEVSGISVERQVIEHRATLPGGQEVIKKEPGPIKFGDITLKRGVTDDDQLYEWIDQVVKGDITSARRNGSIVQYDTMFAEIKRWNFINGWPSKWEAPSFKANANEISVESVTLTVEAIEKG